jgi:Na+-driven multidrug efflux pump
MGQTASSCKECRVSVGEQDRRSLVNVTRIVFTKGMILMACIVAILVVFADPFTRMYYQDPTQPVYDMTAMAFGIVPLCMPMSLISLTFSCFAQTVERKKLALIIPIIDGALDVTVCSIILIPILKMKGLYISSIINGVICMIVIVVSACIETKRFPKCLEDLMAIPGNIGIKLVYKIARQADYQNLLGMNVLTIHFDEDGSKDKV